MKKHYFILLFISLILLVFNISFAYSEENPGESIQKEIGINPENLPTSIDEIKDRYLTQQWEELIDENKYLGPIHRFLKNFFLIKILFGDDYSISLTFLLILILWLFIGVKAGQFISASEIIKGWLAISIGFLLSVILAQTGILKTISLFAISIIFKPENWWMRLILGAIALILFALLFYISRLIEKAIKEKLKKEEESKRKQTQKELEAFSTEIKK